METGAGPGDETSRLLAAVLDPVPALTPALLELTRAGRRRRRRAPGARPLFRALPPGIRSRRAARAAAAAARLPRGPARARHRPDRRDAGRAPRRGDARRRAGAPWSSPRRSSWRGRWAARLERALGEPARLVTSAPRPRERWAAWWACRQGEARLAVGTRAAAWLPLAPLGLAVVVDEEDPAHKSPDAPRWHARDLILERVAPRGRREPPREPRAEPRELGGRPPRARSHGIAARRARGRPSSAWRSGPSEAAAASLSPGSPRRRARRRSRAGGPCSSSSTGSASPGRLTCADCGTVRRCGRCRLALVYHRETRALDVPALRAPRAGREPLRALPRPPAPARRLGHRAARGGGPAGVPRGAGRAIRLDGRPARRRGGRGRRSSRARRGSWSARRWRSGWRRRRRSRSPPWCSPTRRSTCRTSARPSGPSSWAGAWPRRSRRAAASGSSPSCRSTRRSSPSPEASPTASTSRSGPSVRSSGYPPARRMARLLVEGRATASGSRRTSPRAARRRARRCWAGDARGGRAPGGAPGRRRAPEPWPASSSPSGAAAGWAARGSTVDIDPVELP